MKINNKIIIFASVLAIIAVGFIPGINKFFLAAISNVSVNISENITPPTPVVSTGGGGYFPAITTPIPVATPVTSLEPEKNTPVEQQPIQPVNNIQPASASLLPVAVAALSQKIPELATILSNLNVKTTADVAALQNYNIYLPSTNITSENQPTDKVFVLLGKGNINALTRLDFSSNAPALEQINVLGAKPLHLVVKPSSIAKSVTGYVLFDSFSVLKFSYTDKNNDGIFTADINSPAVEGQYQIVTTVNYADAKIPSKDIKITTLIDPDGYIYEEVQGKQLRINNATVSLYKLNPSASSGQANQYVLWNASDYGQENPQITDVTGKYSYLVPEGTYYLSVKTANYPSYKSDIFSVKEGKEIHFNVELKKQFSFYSFLNWTNIVLAVLFVLVCYNFYRDFKRGKPNRKR